jgi:hypothetical protein
VVQSLIPVVSHLGYLSQSSGSRPEVQQLLPDIIWAPVGQFANAYILDLDSMAQFLDEISIK